LQSDPKAKPQKTPLHRDHHTTTRFLFPSLKMGRPQISFGPEQGSADQASILLILLTLLCFLLRYTRLFVGIYANLTYKPIPIPTNPTYMPKDMTVVIPTVFKPGSENELAECIGRVYNCGPKKIFVVVLDCRVSECKSLIASHNLKGVRVLGVPKLGKRIQMSAALTHIQTKIIVWADDDVYWPSDYLQHLVAIFENPKVGAGGTCQRIRRSNGSSWWPQNPFNSLSTGYIERRVFNNLASNAIDGSISTLSGRSAAYRMEILKCEEFMSGPKGFLAGSFRGKKLDSDDDKFLTRWVYSHGWEIAIQTAVCLETTCEENWGYLHQCMRWARARFRGNFTVMSNETYWRSRKYAWGTYNIYLAMFQHPSLFMDLGFAYLLSLILAPYSPEARKLCWIFFLVFMLFTKTVRMIPYFLRHPTDMVHIPMLIAFGWFHSLLNIYCLCTLTQTAWGGKDIAALSKTRDESSKTETTPLLENETVSDGQVSNSPSSS
jgi:cellulose synthase/poly-beta-1,6-N-acetylglucosamine synthase-like glycosyltransferase